MSFEPKQISAARNEAAADNSRAARLEEAARGRERETSEPTYSAAHADVSCCVMLADHAAGPHDEEPVDPTIAPAEHAAALARTFGDARSALDALSAPPLVRPHWLGQVRYRRCAIYFGVFIAGSSYAVVSAWRDWRGEARRVATAI